MDQHDGVGQLRHDGVFDAITDIVGFADAHLRGQGEMEVDMATTTGTTAAQIVKTAGGRAAFGDDAAGHRQLFRAHALVDQRLEGLVEHADRLSDNKDGDRNGDQRVEDGEGVAEQTGQPDPAKTDGDTG